MNLSSSTRRLDRQAVFSGTKEVAAPLAVDTARLHAFLSERLPDFEGPVVVRQFKGGQSNPTYLIETPMWCYVLRRKPPGKLLPSAHAVDREYRVISALHAQQFPVARPLVYCDDPGVVGTPFYVMAYVAGRVIWEPHIPEASAKERGDIYNAMNAALAVAPLSVDLHSDLGWFYFRTGRYDDALRQCRVALQMSARDESAQTCEQRSLAELGHPEQAWEALRRHAPDWLDARSIQEFSEAGTGRAYRMAMHLAAARTRERFGAGFESASLEAIAGDRSAVDADLAAAVALGDPGLHMARVTPELARMLGAPAVRHLAAAGVAPLKAGDSG